MHPKYKTTYRVGNWAEYDRALVRRGDVTLWLTPDAIATWAAAGVGRRSGQLQYSDLAIETALTLSLIFQQGSWAQCISPRLRAKCCLTQMIWLRSTKPEDWRAAPTGPAKRPACHTYATSPPNSAKAARQSTRSSLATRPTAVRWRGSMRWRQAGSYATP